MIDIRKDLEVIGIRKYSNIELETLYNDIIKQIPNKNFGEKVLFHIPNINNNISNKKNVLICSLGGTNWLISLLEKRQESRTLLKKTFNVPSDKEFESLDSFVEEIEIFIEKALLLENNKEIDAIGIALAFPILSKETELGIDAEFINAKMPKEWKIDYISDGQSQYIGQLLLKKLNQKCHNQINKIIIINDVVTLGLKYKLGFIFGTGVNAFCSIKGEIWNTEIGKSIIPKTFIKKDKVLQIQLKNISIVNNLPIIEYLIGGDYIKHRLAISVDLLTNEGYKLQSGLAKQLDQLDTKLVSDFANPNFTLLDLANKYRIKYITKSEFQILKIISGVILEQTAQLIGVIVASTISKSDISKNKNIKFSVEGSVFLGGYNIKELSISTAKDLLNLDNLTLTAIESSSLKDMGDITVAYMN